MQIIKDGQITPLPLTFTPKEHINFKNELVSRLVKGINLSRVGTKYKPVTEKQIAIKINANPFFKGRDDNLLQLIKSCEEKGNYKKFWWVVNTK